MITLTDRSPDTNVCDGEYRRLLGYPRDAVLGERARELDTLTRDWYRAHGRAWVHTQEIRDVTVGQDFVDICGVSFSADRLRRTLERAGAERVAVVIASAGPEAEARAQELWAADKPDEYYFLETYAAAVVEHLVMTTGARLCAWADVEGWAVLPHDSPGYPGWNIAEQPNLLGLIDISALGRDGLDIAVLDSGMLVPKKSQLTVFGLTRHADRVQHLTGLAPCRGCPLAGCQFRRRPYATVDDGAVLDEAERDRAPHPSTAVPYSVNAKALRRWAAERLTLERRTDGTTVAAFRFDGTTCSNMGRPLAFDYTVTMGSRGDGYPIREQHCSPADGDTGHRAMCQYLSQGDHVVTTIASERPLLGRPIADVFGWTRHAMSTGCFCDPDARSHKWGLVLETIHFALHQQQAVGTRETESRS